MKKSIIIAIALLLSASLYGQDLVILHTNDTHSQIEPIRVGKGKGLAGVHRRAEYFAKVKEEHKNVLILDAGDYNQGTPYFTIYKGDMEMELMNSLGYEVVCLGNHEFDNGQTELARRLSSANFTTICANYDFTGTPLEPYIKPYIILNKGGKKIGIIGLIRKLNNLVAAPNLVGMKFNDPIKVANTLAAKLKNEEKCDMVIALTHIGFSSQNPKTLSDISLAEQSRNIDLIIGGHSHTFLKAERVYHNLDGKEVIVVQDGSQGEYVGRFDINWK